MMSTLTQQTNTSHSLLQEAFSAILEKLGPDKTSQVWHVLVGTNADYLTIRPKLFEGKDEHILDEDIEKFNI